DVHVLLKDDLTGTVDARTCGKVDGVGLETEAGILADEESLKGRCLHQHVEVRGDGAAGRLLDVLGRRRLRTLLEAIGSPAVAADAEATSEPTGAGMELQTVHVDGGARTPNPANAHAA